MRSSSLLTDMPLAASVSRWTGRIALEAITQALLDRETITGEDIDLLMEGKELPPVDPQSGAPGRPSASSGGNASG